jgi:hypothetical protein
VAGEPVGWCCCGPRLRYAVALSRRGAVMGGRARADDESVWLVACLFVEAGYRGQGVGYALVGAADELACGQGAAAIEGWPLAGSNRLYADAFLGREKVFEDLGFSCLGRPAPNRVIMRRELGDAQSRSDTESDTEVVAGSGSRLARLPVAVGSAGPGARDVGSWAWTWA